MGVTQPPLLAIDLEGILLPEIWIAVAERTGIPQLRLTTRDVADYDELIRWIVIAVYGTVMTIAIIGPGLTALYYYTRTRHIDAYIHQTPQWILDLQRAGMSV